MNSNSVSAIIDRIDTLPTLPAMVNRVMEVIYDPESSPKDLTQVIEQDQSLTTTILKFANSAFFGFAKKVGTIQHAVTVLGFAEIQNLVLAKSVCNTFKNMKEFEQFDLHKFWEHSFICGLCANIIGGRLKKVSKDFFVGGLIHDVGKLVLCLTYTKEYLRIIQEISEYPNNLLKTENHHFGFTHAEAGMKLVEKWMFPDNLVAAVGYHHTPTSAGDQVLFSTVIYMADIFTHIQEQIEGSRKDFILDEPDFITHLNKTVHAAGIKWEMEEMPRLLDLLAQKKEEESDVMATFFDEK